MHSTAARGGTILSRFATPAFIRESTLDPAQQAHMDQLWTENVEGFTQQAITGDPWNNLNSPIQSSYYDPTKTDIPAGTGTAPVTWFAFPNRLSEYLGQNQAPPNPYNLTQQQLFELADFGSYTAGGQQQSFPGIPLTICPQPDWSGSLHTYGPYGPRGWLDEYCEFSATRNSQGKITRVDIVCENPEYWYTLWRVSPEAAARTYQQALNFGLPAGSSDAVTVTVEDLQLTDGSGNPVIDPSTGKPAYNPLNKWNSGTVSVRGGSNASGGAIHLTSTPNTLQTELGLAGGATVRRTVGNTNPQTLICCSQYGQSYRNSDPHIGQTVNQVVSAGNNVSLANPPGLYIQEPDFSGYQLPPDPKLPPNAQPSDCWQVVRGSATVIDPVTGEAFPGNMILHAAFQIPAAWIEAGVSFTVGDITISLNGQPTPIQYASELLTTFNIGLFARPLPVSQPAALACLVNLPTDQQAAQAQPVQMFYQTVWEAYYRVQVSNPAGVPMSLASNTVIVPPRVSAGAAKLAMVLTCSTAVQGAQGQYPTIAVPEGGVSVTVNGMSTVNYAAPGNSYPSDFQLLSLTVSVDAGARPGPRSIVVTNPPQSGGAPPPASPAPAFLYVVAAGSHN